MVRGLGFGLWGVFHQGGVYSNWFGCVEPGSGVFNLGVVKEDEAGRGQAVGGVEPGLGVFNLGVVEENGAFRGPEEVRQLHPVEQHLRYAGVGGLVMIHA